MGLRCSKTQNSTKAQNRTSILRFCTILRFWATLNIHHSNRWEFDDMVGSQTRKHPEPQPNPELTTENHLKQLRASTITAWQPAQSIGPTFQIWHQNLWMTQSWAIQKLIIWGCSQNRQLRFWNHPTTLVCRYQSMAKMTFLSIEMIFVIINNVKFWRAVYELITY